MKAYITCPVTHTKERLDILPEIEKIAQSKGISTFVFQIGGTPHDIFKRDHEQLKSCDILIAEVSERSHGVGIEIGIASCLNLKIILLHEIGTSVTPLAHGIPGVVIIEYKDLQNLKIELSKVLDRIQ